MKIESVGSFLPDETLISARKDFNHGIISRRQLTGIEDDAVSDIAERQIACGLPFITSGELRRAHWSRDFWFGLNGISCEHIASGHLYQPVESSTDLLHITGQIGFNPEHPFFRDFSFLHDVVSGRASCRQTLPSPANLLLETYAIYNWNPDNPDTLVTDIAEAYRKTALRLHSLGCKSLQFDDTALGLMCDGYYTKRLLQGGMDILKLHSELITVINNSLDGLPDDMEKAIYISGGDTIVPEWEHIAYPDNIMPVALSSLNVDKFFIPFALGNDYAVEVLRHIPREKDVVLGLADAHCPFPEDSDMVKGIIHNAERFIDPSRLYASTRTGFKLSSYSQRALTYEDQWRKLKELSDI